MPGSINTTKKDKIYKKITIHTRCHGRLDAGCLGAAAAFVPARYGNPDGARIDPGIPDAEAGDNAKLNMATAPRSSEQGLRRVVA